MKPRASILDSRSSFSLAQLALLLVAAGVRAQQPWEAVAIDKAAGRTGQFQVILTQRCPLSKPSDVSQRVSRPASAGESDYDLAKEKFDIYVPKSPAADGKFGLMVVMPYPAHATPPHPWTEVLEKSHMIFIGDPTAGDGRPPLARIGLALDAAFDVQKAWPIDPHRIYACTASGADLASGIALYYPDVFEGAICPGWSWWENLSDPKTRAIFKFDKLTRPRPQQLELARAHSRFFLVTRELQDPNYTNPVDLLAKQGYGRAGFKHVKAVTVPSQEIMIWSTLAADWFEEGLQFLDAGASDDAKAVTASGKQPAGPTGTGDSSALTRPNSTPPAGDPTARAQSALSLAKSYITAQHYDAARAKLQSVIQTYPQTPAATEAKSLLKEIQDK
ncbi:MAG TPA: hypothetical protein VK797_30800 [Tepidisphaeraceae bacterium]|nr:hypothetical protein [Tepidisphaeraceae bacterium]